MPRRLIANLIQVGWTCCLVVALVLPVAAADTPVLNNQTIIKLVRDAKVFEPDAQIIAYVNGKEIIVQSYLNPKANDDDCKIDALLIGKAIFDVFPPPAFSNVRVELYDSKDASRITYRSVIVRAGDIDVFAKGGISKEALLASLTVAHERRTDVVTRPSPRAILNVPITSAFRKKERQDLLRDIRDLQSKNQDLRREVADVDKCCRLFGLSEACVRKEDEHGFVRAYNDTVIAVNEEQAKVNRAITELNHKLPVNGPQYERRVAVYRRLAYLEQHGKNVTQLRRIFENYIERQASLGQDSLELDTTLSTIERALSKM